MAEISIQNINIYYEKYEHAEPRRDVALLLIHGFLSSTFSFRRLIPLLRKEYTVISIDLPGFGKSEKALHFTYSYENYGKLILTFIEALGLNKVIIIGHSMGGQIALHIAKQEAEKIEKLILLGSSGYLGKAKRRTIYSSYLPFYSWFLKRWFYKQDVKENLLSVVHDTALIDEESIQGYTEPFKEKNFILSMVRLLRHREGDLTSHELKDIHTPCLLIWGENDETVPLDVGKRLATDLPNAELVVYDKVGHLIPEEKPEELMVEFGRFI